MPNLSLRYRLGCRASLEPQTKVLLEMLRPPVNEVILLGYELTDLKVLHLLVDVEAAGADVIIICDRTRGTAERLLELGFRRPRVFQDRERLDGAP